MEYFFLKCCLREPFTPHSLSGWQFGHRTTHLLISDTHELFIVPILHVVLPRMVYNLRTMAEYKLYLGDCLDILPTLVAGSVDAVITDPPYAKEYIHLWEPFAIESERLLGDRRELITLLGHYQLPDVIHAFHETNMRFWWICGMRQTARTRLWGKRVNVYWKPALWYIKGKKRALPDMPSDLVLGSKPEKSQHPWEQGIAWFEHWVERTTLYGETVLDPFMGSGTTGVACMQLGRKFIGIEKEERYFNIARQRMKDATKQLALFSVEVS